jgi:hypothetical protein
MSWSDDIKTGLRKLERKRMQELVEFNYVKKILIITANMSDLIKPKIMHIPTLETGIFLNGDLYLNTKEWGALKDWIKVLNHRSPIEEYDVFEEPIKSVLVWKL